MTTNTNPSSQRTPTTLVLGATGKTGRRVAERLRRRGLPVRLGSRSARPGFDWNDRSSWAAALASVDTVYVSYYPDVAVPGAVETIRDLADAAVGSGVRRLVFLSGRGEEEAERAEEMIRAAGAEWTIVRSTWFAQNFDESYFAEPIRHGELALPVGAVSEPFVDADDIADVAVAALTHDRHVGQLYELTGPRLLTFADAVAEIAEATGRDLRYREISTDEFAAGLAAEGTPSDVIELLTYLFTTVLDGRNSHVTDGVERALGRPPRDFAGFARDAAATGV